MIWGLELDDQGVGKMASSEDPFGLYYIKNYRGGASSCPYTVFPHYRCVLTVSYLQKQSRP